MFELGLRLAFDKPTIIVKDDATTYSFDTSPIEHLAYPRDLRFQRIVDFKASLAAKIKATHESATADANYTTFLKHFGTFTVAKLDETEVSANEYILEELRELRLQFLKLADRSYSNRYRASIEDPEVLRAISSSIREFVSTSGLRAKRSIRARRKDAANYVLQHAKVGRYFGTPEEFYSIFDVAFNMLYGM